MIASLTRTLLFLLLLATGAAADSLPLPEKLVDLRSPRGEAFLLEAHALEAYFPISVVFETQKTQAYCGVASMVMVLNALRAPAPTSPEYQPYSIFTQDNLLDEKSDAIRPRDLLAHRGMTLDQLGEILALHPVTVEVHHAAADGVDEFRKSAADYLARENHFVIVNYYRKALGQEWGGHISPLAAYDEKNDRFLILDVARYKYPPVWVTTSDLFDAMNTPDPDNADKTRGWVLIAGHPPASAPAQ
jgi:Phytochelatin synthase